MIRLLLAALLVVSAPFAASRIAVDGTEAIVVGALVGLVLVAGIAAAGAELRNTSAHGRRTRISP